LVGDSGIVGDFLPEGNNDLSISMGEGLRDDYIGVVLFLVFNSGEGFFLVRLFGYHIDVVSLGELFSRFFP
jgi:hypothetical protein